MRRVSKNTIAKYVALVSTPGRVWTESELVSFRTLINTNLRHEPDMRDMLVERFNASLDVVPFQLEQSQQSKGVAWLRKTQLDKKGELRDASTTFISYFELSVLNEFSSIELVGLRNITVAFYTPIYRVNGISGAYFEYCLNSYGTFEVTDIRYARGA